MPSIGGYHPYRLASILTGLESNRACVGYAWPTNCSPCTPPTCLPELRRALLDEWCNIPQDQIDNLILSMPRRCKACIASSTRGNGHKLVVSRDVKRHGPTRPGFRDSATMGTSSRVNGQMLFPDVLTEKLGISGDMSTGNMSSLYIGLGLLGHSSCGQKAASLCDCKSCTLICFVLLFVRVFDNVCYVLLRVLVKGSSPGATKDSLIYVKLVEIQSLSVGMVEKFDRGISSLLDLVTNLRNHQQQPFF
ncbi:uncharacterized protein TNCV_3308551 [Trichonephila clavipes]|nr:uncharacterized protein TNCV_3308551 [Trichonephila clavipes]